MTFGLFCRSELPLNRCHVCGESFKERHHMTRHMTAHREGGEDSI